MPFLQVGELRYYQFSQLLHPNLKHAIFTRRGGVSPSPWRSLNVGATVGDSPDRVSENRRRMLNAIGREVDSLFDVWQVHSGDVVEAHNPRRGSQPLKADGIITNQPHLTLLMRFADCVPILLHDPIQHAIGLVHAGWLGTVRKTVVAAVEAMQRAYRTQPQDLLAGIGPSIGPDHYPVGPDVIEQVERAFGDASRDHLVLRGGQVHFNLWTANEMLLTQAGVASIEVAALCTACHLEDWFSHRGEYGQTGRFGAAIAIHG